MQETRMKNKPGNINMMHQSQLSTKCKVLCSRTRFASVLTNQAFVVIQPNHLNQLGSKHDGQTC